MISPTRAKSSGSETLLRIRSLAGCTIDTHESSFRKRHLADLDAELQQFPVDAGRPPQRVGFAHAADQITDFCADLGSSRTARSPPPKEPEALAMPLDHGGRLDQYHRVDDLRPNPVEPHPQEPV